MSLREIGQRIGKHPYYLSKALREAGIEVIRHRYNSYKPLPSDEELLDMYGTKESPGKTMVEIAKEKNVRLTSVHARLSQLGADVTIHQSYPRKDFNPIIKLPSRKKLRQMLNSNTYQEIAEMHGVTFDAVFKKATSAIPSRLELKAAMENQTVEQVAEDYGLSVAEVRRKATFLPSRKKLQTMLKSLSIDEIAAKYGALSEDVEAKATQQGRYH